MDISKEIKAIIEQAQKLDGYICHGLVNYQKGVAALKEDSSPSDKENYFPQQCSAVVNTITQSLRNLDGGTPQRFVVEAERMTMVITIVNATYFCGVGLQPGTPSSKAEELLSRLATAMRKQV